MDKRTPNNQTKYKIKLRKPRETVTNIIKQKLKNSLNQINNTEQSKT